jgi:hypothetical protein
VCLDVGTCSVYKGLQRGELMQSQVCGMAGLQAKAAQLVLGTNCQSIGGTIRLSYWQLFCKLLLMQGRWIVTPGSQYLLSLYYSMLFYSILMHVLVAETPGQAIFRIHLISPFLCVCACDSGRMCWKLGSS